MAKCKKCGKGGIFFKVNSNGICKDCERIESNDKNREKQEIKENPLAIWLKSNSKGLLDNKLEECSNCLNIAIKSEKDNDFVTTRRNVIVSINCLKKYNKDNNNKLLTLEESLRKELRDFAVYRDPYYNEYVKLILKNIFDKGSILQYELISLCNIINEDDTKYCIDIAVQDGIITKEKSGRSYKLTLLKEIEIKDIDYSTMASLKKQYEFKNNKEKYNELVEFTDISPYWQITELIDKSTSVLDNILNGITRRYDDPFWNVFYPPNTLTSNTSIRALSKEYLKGKKINSGLPTLQEVLKNNKDNPFIDKKTIEQHFNESGELILKPDIGLDSNCNK